MKRLLHICRNERHLSTLTMVFALGLLTVTGLPASCQAGGELCGWQKTVECSAPAWYQTFGGVLQVPYLKLGFQAYLSSSNPLTPFQPPYSPVPPV